MNTLHILCRKINEHNYIYIYGRNDKSQLPNMDKKFDKNVNKLSYVLCHTLSVNLDICSNARCAKYACVYLDLIITCTITI